MAGYKAIGSKLSVDTSATSTPTWTQIANLTSIGEIGLESDEIDVTTLDSTGDFKEFIGGAKDGGSIDLEGNIGNYLQESSAVNAACDWSGPIDLTAMDCGESMKMGENSPEDVLLNSKLAKEPDKYISLSANHYVRT